MSAANEPRLDVNFALRIGRFCGPSVDTGVRLNASHAGWRGKKTRRKKKKKSNPASHTAGIQRCDTRHTTRQTMKNWTGSSIKQWY